MIELDKNIGNTARKMESTRTQVSNPETESEVVVSPSWTAAPFKTTNKSRPIAASVRYNVKLVAYHRR